MAIKSGAGQEKKETKAVSSNVCRNSMSSIVSNASDRLIRRTAVILHNRCIYKYYHVQ